MAFRSCGISFRSRKGAGMDNQDKDFEAFLQRFQLRKPAPFLEAREEVVPMRRRAHWWLLAGATIASAAILVSVSMFRGTVPPSPPAVGVEVTPVLPSNSEDKASSAKPVQAGEHAAATTAGQTGGSEKESPVLAE